MNALASAGAQLAFFALSFGLMRLALAARPKGGIFTGLTLGLLPAAALSVAQFWAMQQPTLAAAQDERAVWTDFAQKMALSQAPAPSQAALRTALVEAYNRALEAEPAGQFCLIMIVLAPLAAYLRRRQARRGQAPDPGPLSRWCAPWGLVWLVLGPVFWLEASWHGFVAGTDWADHLALNLLTVGSVIFLFQGLVVAGAKVGALARDPRTRGLAVLSVACLGFALLFADRSGLLQMFVLTLMILGILEPWVDLRRLRTPAPKSGA